MEVDKTTQKNSVMNLKIMAMNDVYVKKWRVKEASWLTTKLIHAMKQKTAQLLYEMSVMELIMMDIKFVL